MAPLRAAARSAVELFDWWRMELRDLAQWGLRQLPSRKSPEVLLRVVNQQLSIERREQADWKPFANLAHDADGSAELPALPADLRDARTAIGLADSEFFFDEFELPLATERHLASVLRLQLERRLPIPLTELLSDHQVLSTDKKRGVLRVRVAVAHRDRVEKLRELATRLGLNPVSAGLLSVEGSLQFNLLRRRRDPLRWHPSPLDLRLMKLAAGAAAALLAVIGAQWMYERAQVRDAVEELRAQADQLRTTRAELNQQAEPVLALRRASQVSAAPELLATLSRAVLAPAWFSHVVLSTPVDGVATVQLTGEVTSQEQVLNALRAVPGIRNLKTSSAFSGEILGPERLELTAEYVPAGVEGAAP
jgi:hypothetical protein